MADAKKLGDLIDRLSILELQEFMGPRFRGRGVDFGATEEIHQIKAWLKNLFNQDRIERSQGSIAELQKLNTRIWMFQHVESEVDKAYVGRPGSEPHALAAIGMIHRRVMEANTLRAQVIAKLNDEAVRKIY